MVEGPGASNNAKKARTLVGRVVTSISGASAECATRAVGASLGEVISLGKEVWLIFAAARVPAGAADEGVIDLCSSDEDEASTEEIGVRLHFGMSGSLRLDGHRSTRPVSSRAVEALRVDFEGDRSLVVYGDGTTGSVVKACPDEARRRTARFEHLDVCSDAFDACRAAEAVREGAKGRSIAAVLMDQRVSPGTGNIIKQEALHRARVDPLRPAESLGLAERSRVVGQVRRYARAWQLKSRPPCLVYNRTACGTCCGPVTVLKDDTVANRVTFSCKACVSDASAPDAPAKPPSDKKRHREPAMGLLHDCKAPSEKLQRVRKSNANASRLFWSCRRKGCHAKFKWADDAFPKCKCKAVSRLKLCKQGAKAGSFFYCCYKPKGTADNCAFFQWADATALDAAFGDALTPLI